MFTRRTLVTGALAATALPTLASAQVSANQIRLVVPYGPGGSTDTSARVLAERMATDLGKSIIVENRPGGGTMIGMANVAKSKPDGTSLLLLTTTAALLPAFDIPLQIDPQKELAMVSQLADIPCVLAVNAKHPAKTFPEFLEWVKAQPGPVHYATSSSGGLPHLWGELISTKAGGKLQHIPYKAAAEALRDTVAGHTQVFVDVTMPVDAQINAGTMRGLICGAQKRVANVSSVPTASELGMPDLEAAVYFGVATTAGTAPDVIAYYNAAINAALKVPAVQERLASMGYIPTGGTPEAYTKRLADETVRWRKVIKAANIPAPA
ncbi:tripartite tricarboxylate transporter substrate binding protein [Reyranella sp.]|uniref:Bug family tripartite tricarboxylate transporter substrate binding protein n=1 Tax=Reyranella sp. TaxID=1929291 RepID=UPI00121AEBDC|nr:tripartite tricarboxylate transporter substrate binding protein [Reyranella sp.]TAJ88098.1 MAG: tripartite tricarboxylate transporter substrate binding protein [Reyranella sp.]